MFIKNNTYPIISTIKDNSNFLKSNPPFSEVEYSKSKHFVNSTATYKEMKYFFTSLEKNQILKFIDRLGTTMLKNYYFENSVNDGYDLVVALKTKKDDFTYPARTFTNK